MYKDFKLFNIFVFLVFVLNIFIPTIYADDTNENIEESLNINEQVIETVSNQTNLPEINSRAAVVIDRNSNTILYGKNENAKRKMASTTKIMTCLLVIENCNLSDTVEVSKKSAGTGGSRLGLKTGDKITVQDLLYGLMLCSGNDTAVALAEHVSGSVENFSVVMNNKAKEIGLNNTNFETPHGLDSENHYTTAYELALLANYALNNSTFAKIVGTKSHTVTINGYPKTIQNTNELLGNLNGVYGIKTGFTNGANRCLVTSCKRNNLDIICVVLGADTKNFRTKDSIKLIEYSFKTYEPVSVQQFINNKFDDWKQKNLDNFFITKGEHQNIEIKINPLKYDTIPIEKSSINNLNCFVTCQKNFEAPIFSNTPIGIIYIYCNDKIIAQTEILLDCNIQKKNITNYFFELWKLIGNIQTTIF